MTIRKSAKLQTLEVNNREITRDMAEQLDRCPWRDIKAYGRVSINDRTVIGVNPQGELALARYPYVELSPTLDLATLTHPVIVCLGHYVFSSQGHAMRLDEEVVFLDEEAWNPCGVEGHDWGGEECCASPRDLRGQEQIINDALLDHIRLRDEVRSLERLPKIILT